MTGNATVPEPSARDRILGIQTQPSPTPAAPSPDVVTLPDGDTILLSSILGARAVPGAVVIVKMTTGFEFYITDFENYDHAQHWARKITTQAKACRAEA